MKINIKRTMGFLLIMAMVSVTALATPALAEELDITGIRTISVTEAAPGDTFTVTVEMQVTGDNATDRLINTELAETLPFGWTVTENDSASMSFSGATPNYAWQDTTGELATGDVLTIVYDVTIPELEEGGEKSITGAVSALRNSTGITVGDAIDGQTTVTVTESVPYTYIHPGDSLQEAVDNAGPGDIIMMAPGTYYCDTDWGMPFLFIYKPDLTFMADGEVIIDDDSGWGGSINLGAEDPMGTAGNATGTTFNGITFTSMVSVGTLDSDIGIISDIVFEDCNLNSSTTLFDNYTIRNCYASYLSTYGDNLLIENSTIVQLRQGSASVSSDGVTVRNCSISNDISQATNTGVLIEDCVFGSGSEIDVRDSTAIIRNNDFLGGCTYSNLDGHVYLNNFTSYTPSGSAIFNTTEEVTYTYGGHEYTGYLGNYYSDYAGSDTNRDGVGEGAHGNDIYPLMGAWNDGEIACNLPPQPMLSFVPVNATVIDGQTTEIVISVDSLPAGLSGYNFTVDIGDRNVSNIVNITYPEWVTMSENSTLPRGSIYLKALDGNETIQAGATDVELATLTVKGKNPGLTNFTLAIDRLDDDDGEPIDSILEVGDLEVTFMPIPGYTESPQDLNCDGIYEDLTGDGTFSFVDVQEFFYNMDWIETHLPIENFDLNGNGRIDFDDVVDLFQMVV